MYLGTRLSSLHGVTGVMACALGHATTHLSVLFRLPRAVNSTDNATIAACVTSRYMDIVGAGVSASVLFARASCAGAAYPFPPPLASPPPLLSTAANGTGSVSAPPAPPPPQCPIKYALSFFGAPLACQNASTYCTDCANALSLPIALAGAHTTHS